MISSSTLLDFSIKFKTSLKVLAVISLDIILLPSEFLSFELSVVLEECILFSCSFDNFLFFNLSFS